MKFWSKNKEKDGKGDMRQGGRGEEPHEGNAQPPFHVANVLRPRSNSNVQSQIQERAERLSLKKCLLQPFLYYT